MPQISLAKSLKLKNRLVSRLAKVSEEIKGNNCKIDGQERLDIKSRLELREELISSVISLKTAIYKGNVGIQETLFGLSEKKSSITFYTGMDTRNESNPHGYQNTPIVYVAHIRKEDCLANIKRLEAEIDDLQEKVDEYNYTTKIEVSQRTLDLAS